MRRIRIFPSFQNVPFEEIKHFFTVYKDLEGKRTAVDEFEGALGAVKIIEECIDRYKEKYGSGESDKTTE